MNYVGIDHHRQYSHMTMMDQEGQVLRSGRVPNLRSEIERFLGGVAGGGGAGIQSLFRQRSEGALGAGLGVRGEKTPGGAPEDLSSPRDKDRGVDRACGEAL